MNRRIALSGLGIVAPGLDGWEMSAPILAGRAAYPDESSLPPLKAGLLKPILRRRTTATTRLAIDAGEQAIAHSGLAADGICTLFSSSDGDLEVADALCQTLATPDRPVSPTQFHNSVHNAPAAYWSIGIGSQYPSTSIAVYSASFTSGLLEAVAFVRTEDRKVLFVAYDSPAPHPLSRAVPVSLPFAVAMVLAPIGESGGRGRLGLELTTEREQDRMLDPGLERLRQANSAAHCLPLLAAIARGASQTLVMPYLRTAQLVVEYRPETAGSPP